MATKVVELGLDRSKSQLVFELFNLYKACFADIIRDEAVVWEILRFPENHFIVEEADGKIIGTVVINANVVMLFCVHPDYRRQGIGSRLLVMAEDFVRKNGFEEIKFCDGKEYITPGIPMSVSYEGNDKFFIKRGYVHSWGDESECVDMSLNLCDFNATEKMPGDEIDGVVYRWAEQADFDNVVECVDAGHSGFTDYYRDDFLYKDSMPFRERALIAVKNGKVCGALLVGNGTDMKGLGSVGCTVTHSDYRNQGIATNMVKIGTHHLQSLGLEKGFLGYTYTDIIPMYGRSGYKVCMKYFMGVKKL